MIETLKAALLGSGATDTVVECRSCGAAVDDDAESCPECGSSEIARYRL